MLVGWGGGRAQGDHTGEGGYLSPEAAAKPGDGIPSMNEQSPTDQEFQGHKVCVKEQQEMVLPS